MERKIYVHRGTIDVGYLAKDGTALTGWADRAAVFSSPEKAEAEIRRRGWENTTQVKPGVTTAYVCE